MKSNIAALAHDFLSQPNIAVVGISTTKQTVANGVYRKLKSERPHVIPVGRHAAAFDGDECYPTLTSIPSNVDGVFIATQQKETERIVEECIALRIPRVWMHNMTGVVRPSSVPSSLSSVSPSAVARCRENDITVIPGACPMMFCASADAGHRCIRWMLSVAGRLRV